MNRVAPALASAKMASQAKVVMGITVVVLIFAVAVGIVAVVLGATTRPNGDVAWPKGALTFNRDIAPIVLNHCAPCHRPGQSAPFNLLTCEDVKKHAKQIVEVIGRRYMPPWLPEPGYGDFFRRTPSEHRATRNDSAVGLRGRR